MDMYVNYEITSKLLCSSTRVSTQLYGLKMRVVADLNLLIKQRFCK